MSWWYGSKFACDHCFSLKHLDTKHNSQINCASGPWSWYSNIGWITICHKFVWACGNKYGSLVIFSDLPLVCHPICLISDDFFLNICPWPSCLALVLLFLSRPETIFSGNPDFSFPFHTYRLVLCDPRILNCPERADWRNCTDNVEEETQLTSAMRDKFAPYDIDWFVIVFSLSSHVNNPHTVSQFLPL